MNLHLLILCLLVTWVRMGQGAPEVVERPLTALDLKLVQTAASPAISVLGRDNQTCLLTKRYVPAGGEECTWREGRVCSLHPTIRKVAIFPRGCSNPGAQGLRLRDCQENLSRKPVVQSLKVCTSKSKEQCPEPCLNCPTQEVGEIATHCRQKKQFWCETSHVVKSSLVSRKICREGEEVEIDKCQEVLTRREEKQRLETVRDCREKEVGEQCAPINCRFVDLGQDCVWSNKTLEVQLIDRVCTVCEPIVGEQVTMKEVCEDGTTRTCDDDPLAQLWKKFCTVDIDETEVAEAENEISPVSLKGLVASSLNPVNELFEDELEKIKSNEIDLSFTDNRDAKTVFDSSIKFKFADENPENATELISQSNKKFPQTENEKKEPTATSPTTLLQPETESHPILPTRRKPQSSVYFDQQFQFVPVLNNRFSDEATDIPLKNTNIENKSTTKASTLLSNIETTKTNSEETITEMSPTSQSTPIIPQTLTTNVGISNNLNNEDIVQTTLKFPIKAIPPSTTVSTTEIKEQLSNTDLLKSCLLFGTGCEFSLNNVDTAELRVTQQVTTTPTTVHTTSMEDQVNTDRLKYRLACLFAGTCDLEDQIYPTNNRKTTVRTTSTTTALSPTTSRSQITRDYSDAVHRLACLFSNNCEETKTTTSPPRTPSPTVTIRTLNSRTRELEKKVRARAEACFTFGDC